MTDSIIEQILYGRFRPWQPGSTEKLKAHLQRKGGKTGAREEADVEWLSAVDPPRPFNTDTLTFRKAITEHIHRSYSRVVREIEEKESDLDQRYLFKSAVRDAKDIIEEARRLCDNRAADQTLSDNQDTAKTVRFVLNDICLQYINLLLDLGLRYPDMEPEYTYTVDHIYPELLDESPPESPPFRKTAVWFRKEIEHELKALAEAPQTDITAQSSAVIHLLVEFGKQLKNNTESYDFLKIQQLLHHVENALFLKYTEAAFLEKDPDKLTDEGYCREWVNGMKREVINGMNKETGMQQLQEAFEWLEDVLAPINEYFGSYTRSAARRWGDQFRRVTAEPSATDKKVTAGKEKGPEQDTDFVQYFRQHFIHRQELQQALGVGKKTVESYLEESAVQALTLNANVWYRRSDVEQFLEENTE